jgi:hypothetical protein
MNQELLELRWRWAIDEKMAAVLVTLCPIPPRNNNQLDPAIDSYEHINDPFGFIKGVGFHYCVKDYTLLKKDTTQWS